MRDPALQNALNAIAREEFRDLADYDYISARISFRLSLREQFYWSGLQAVEKYLKAILLFSGQKIENIRHHVAAANEQITRLARVPLMLDGDQLRLLHVLEELGNNRYRTSYTRMLGDELPKLDSLVWTIRHYARNTILEVDGVDKSDWYAQYLVPPNPGDTPTSNQIGEGELEKILARESSDLLKQELVWCNCFYGKSENAVLAQGWNSSSHIPVYEREWFRNGKCTNGGYLADEIRKYVKF